MFDHETPNPRVGPGGFDSCEDAGINEYLELGEEEDYIYQKSLACDAGDNITVSMID